MSRTPAADGEESRPVAGVVLAAGISSRMETGFKLLLPYGEGTVVEAAVRSALDAGLDPVVVVTGHRGDEVRRTLETRFGGAGADVRIVFNPRFPEGQARSLARGVLEVRTATEAAAAAVLLGDEPGIRTEVVREVVEAWRRETEGRSGAAEASPGAAGCGGRGEGRPVARARYRDRPGHPVVVPRDAFPALERLEGDRGARSWMERNAARVAEVRIDAEAPVDLDSDGDYRRVAAEKAAEGPSG